MKKLFGDFLRNESGASAVEYGLLMAGVSIAIIGIVSTLGGQVKTAFTAVSTSWPATPQ